MAAKSIAVGSISAGWGQERTDIEAGQVSTTSATPAGCPSVLSNGGSSRKVRAAQGDRDARRTPYPYRWTDRLAFFGRALASMSRRQVWRNAALKPGHDINPHRYEGTLTCSLVVITVHHACVSRPYRSSNRAISGERATIARQEERHPNDHSEIWRTIMKTILSALIALTFLQAAVAPASAAGEYDTPGRPRCGQSSPL